MNPASARLPQALDDRYRQTAGLGDGVIAQQSQKIAGNSQLAFPQSFLPALCPPFYDPFLAAFLQPFFTALYPAFLQPFRDPFFSGGAQDAFFITGLHQSG